MNYYEILNVKYDASADEIKKSYKEIAVKLHPDSNNGNQFFAEQFKIVNNAYSVLVDDLKREAYDMQIGVKRKPQLFEEMFLKEQYETAIKKVKSERYNDVYQYLLEQTDSKYLSKIIVDAAVQYNNRKKENEEEKIKNKINNKQKASNDAMEICPSCGKESEKRRNICEHCFAYKK